MRGKTVLITGGAGFIGSNLARSLSDSNRVIVLDNLSTGTLANLAGVDVKFIKGNVLNKALVERVCKQVDYVFHLAAMTSVVQSVEEPERCYKLNLLATLSILDSCVKHGIKKFVFTSSAAVYGNSPKLPKREDMLPMPISPYAASKLGVEHACIVYNYLYRLNFVCLRVFNVYGPRQDPSNQYSGVISKFMQAALSNKPLIIYGDGTQTRDFVYVVDVVDALQRAATARVNGVFNIATGNATPIQRLAKLVIKLTGSKSSIKHLPRREGDVRASRASIAKAKRLLGWKPKIGLEQGLGYTIEWFKTKA